MRWIISSAVSFTYGARAEKSVMRFADEFAANRMGDFQKTFMNIAQAAQRKYKFSWAESADESQQVKGNIVGVLGSQFKPLKGKSEYMPLSASMNLAYDIDALCDVKPSHDEKQAYQSEIKQFLSSWKSVATPDQSWSADSTALFANTVRALRKRCEWRLGQGVSEASTRERLQRFQAKLCYIEAGIYTVSAITYRDEAYHAENREVPPRQNILTQGFYDDCQPPIKGDKGAETTAREMRHDVLIQGLFAQEEQQFDRLDIKTAAPVRVPVLSSDAGEIGKVANNASEKSRYQGAINHAHHTYRNLLAKNCPEIANKQAVNGESQSPTPTSTELTKAAGMKDNNTVTFTAEEPSPIATHKHTPHRNGKTSKALSKIKRVIQSLRKACSRLMSRYLRRS